MKQASHALWVRITHGAVAVSFAFLVVSGFLILMCHPRLYWGEAGNDLTPAWLELPISRNHHHGGWTQPEPFFEVAGSPVSASRTFEIFNQNGWARSLHFLAAWALVLPGITYLLLGAWSKHFARHLAPGREAFRLGRLREEIVRHARFDIPQGSGGPRYGLLQKWTYCAVVFLLFPVVVLSGLALSPAIAAASPALPAFFGGHQSARSVHFLAFACLLGFFLVHLVMVARSGGRRQVRSITLGH